MTDAAHHQANLHPGRSHRRDFRRQFLYAIAINKIKLFRARDKVIECLNPVGNGNLT